MPARTAITDEWIAACEGARPFMVAAGWGTASGIVASPAERRGILGRVRRPSAPRPVALVAPQWPGLEEADRVARIDDAVSVGLLRGGVSVARISSLEWAGAPDAGAWVDAVAECLQSAAAGSAQPALAGSWLAGCACALAASRRDDLAFLVLAGAPSAEVMSRRTPENEDDPMWESSAALRLADTLSALAPLEAVTVGARPTLVVQGAVDALLGASHLEAWRAALAATGRPSDGMEVAFADAFFRSCHERGAPVADDDASLGILAGAVAEWVQRAVSRGPARRAR
jgi:hypothetical protein